MRAERRSHPPASVERLGAAVRGGDAQAQRPGRREPRRGPARERLRRFPQRINAKPVARNLVLRIAVLILLLPGLTWCMSWLSGHGLIGLEGRIYYAAAAMAVALAVVAGMTVVEMLGSEVNTRDELEALVRERTRELIEVNRELDAFGMTVSHDLRSPLRALEATTQALLEGEWMSPTVSSGLGEIRKTTAKLGETLDGLHDLSQASIKPLALEPCRPEQIAAEALVLLGAEQQGRRVEITIEPMPAVIADPRLLRVIYRNLIGNALKFSAATDPSRITVSCLHHYDYCVFFVDDDGPGFDAGDDGETFRLGARFGSPLPGSGVGLPTVRRIVERFDGHVWIESAPGSGTTVSFTIPLAEPRLGLDRWEAALTAGATPDAHGDREDLAA